MFNKDTFRLIKRTKKRFLTLFIIVIIGVGFMVGLLSSSPYLQYSVDKYNDEYNLMDVQIYSSYGFCDEDLDAIKKTRGVEKIQGTKFVDAYGRTNADNYLVTRVQELDSKVNQFKLKEGKLPSKSNEALVLDSKYNNNFKIGDVIILDDVDEKLSNNKYTIVGKVDSPQYLSATLEVSTLKNLDLNTVIYVPNENFIFDFYTSVFVTFDDTNDKVAFTKEYNETVDKDIRVLERTKNAQSNYLKEQIIEDVKKQISDGQTELDTKLADAEKEIAVNENKLNDAYLQIVTGEAQINATKKQLDQAKKEIQVNQKLIDENQKKVDEGLKLVENSGKTFDVAYKEAETAYNLYISLELAQKQLPDKIKAGETKLAANKTEIDSLQSQILPKQAQLIEEKAKLEALKVELSLLTPDTSEYETKSLEVEAQETKVSDLETEINKTNVKIAELQAENAALKAFLESDNEKVIQDTLDELNKQGDVKEIYYNLKQLKDGQEQLASAKIQLSAGKSKLEDGKKQLASAEEDLKKGRSQYQYGLSQLNEAKETLETEKEKAEIELAKAKQQLDELPEADWMILNRDAHYSSVMFKSTLDQMGSIGRIFPLLFFAVAALVCLTTMTRLIDEERTQLGVFSALGFSKIQIILKYVLYAFLASFGGSLIGIVVGVYTFPLVIYWAWRLMYYLPPVQKVLLPEVAFTGVVSFTLLMMGVTYYVAHRELKTMPSQLMRPKPPKTAKQTFIEKIPVIWNHLSFTSRITARNILRYKKRFVMTVIGVAGCTGLLVAGWGIKDSIADVIRLNFTEIYQYDYTISLEDSKYEESVYKALDKDDNIVVPFEQYMSKVYLEDKNKTISVEVFDKDNIDKVVNLRTRKKQTPLNIKGDGVIISEKFAKDNHLNIGDEITIESKNGIKSVVDIDGICEMYFQHHLFMSDELYEEVFNEKNHNTKLALISDEKPAEMEGIQSITSFEPMIKSFENMIQALDFIIIVIILAAGSLAFVVLMNLTAVNISERLREIATLKVLGFNDKEINHYIFEEILILTIIGGLVGLPVGKLEHTIIMTTIDVEMVMFGSNIRFLSFFYGFLVTMCFTAIVLFFMKKNLKDVEMVESLKSVE